MRYWKLGIERQRERASESQSESESEGEREIRRPAGVFCGLSWIVLLVVD
jgi:hypothetical protein